MMFKCRIFIDDLNVVQWWKMDYETPILTDNIVIEQQVGEYASTH